MGSSRCSCLIVYFTLALSLAFDSGCYFQEGTQVNLKMDLATAFQKSIETLIDFVHTKVNTNMSHVLFRTYAPLHISGGGWSNGGYCHNMKQPDFGPTPDTTEKSVDIVCDVLSKQPGRLHVMELMNVTPMADRRQDGHTSLYHFGAENETEPPGEDCSHWCFPVSLIHGKTFFMHIFLERESSLAHPIRLYILRLPFDVHYTWKSLITITNIIHRS